MFAIIGRWQPTIGWFSGFPAVSLPSLRLFAGVVPKYMITRVFPTWGKPRKIFTLSFPVRQGTGEAALTPTTKPERIPVRPVRCRLMGKDQCFRRGRLLRLTPSRLPQNTSSSSSCHSISASQHAPHCRGRLSRNSASLTPDNGGVRQQPVAAVFGKQRQGSRAGLALLKNLDRPPPRQFLQIVDLAQVQHVALHHAPAGHPRVFNNAPVAVLLAILPANFGAQEHDGRELSAHPRP